MLAVDVICLAVSYTTDAISVVVILSRAVYFQLDAEVSRSVAVEDWIGLVRVFFDAVISPMITVAGFAICFIVIVVACIALMDYSTAVFAGSVMFVVTSLSVFFFFKIGRLLLFCWHNFGHLSPMKDKISLFWFDFGAKLVLF